MKKTQTADNKLGLGHIHILAATNSWLLKRLSVLIKKQKKASILSKKHSAGNFSTIERFFDNIFARGQKNTAPSNDQVF